jgi:hypothetical protein
LVGAWIAGRTSSHRTFEKVSFQCPAEHTERLEELLPSVIVLVIGWRGREHHFTNLCREGMQGYPETTIVGSNPASAKEIGAYLVQGVPLRIRPSRANGFSDFLRGDRVVSAWQGDESAT